MQGTGTTIGTAKELFLEAMRRTDAREFDGFLELLAEDTAWSVPGARLEGREAVREWMSTFWRAFSSFRHDVLTALEVDGTVAADGTFTGTHDGPLAMPSGEVPPTGRTVSFRWAMVAEIDVDAQAVRTTRLYLDELAFLGQLGLAPAPAPSSTAV